MSTHHRMQPADEMTKPWLRWELATPEPLPERRERVRLEVEVGNH